MRRFYPIDLSDVGISYDAIEKLLIKHGFISESDFPVVSSETTMRIDAFAKDLVCEFEID